MPVIPVVIAAVVGTLLLAVVLTAIVLVMQWRSEQRSSARHFPLIVPSYSENTWQPEPFEAEVPVRKAPMMADAIERDRTVSRTVDAPETQLGSGVGISRVSAVRSDNGSHATNGYPDEPEAAETMRFSRPVEEVLQLLPGRLEVLAGETRHREIRFVRAPGQPPQMILGRDAAGSPQHVALQSSTVSRRHARLAYANGHWAVANLSQTNPVIVNDEELSGVDKERPLVDGDRIELGEVVLRFHEH